MKYCVVVILPELPQIRVNCGAIKVHEIGFPPTIVLSIATMFIDELVQERCNSIADTLELRLSCTNPSI